MTDLVTFPSKAKPRSEDKLGKFPDGAAVVLKAGSTPMTVEESKGARVTAVWHNAADDLCTGFFKASMLRYFEQIETAPPEETPNA